ncbi:MAG: phenylacetic acid degradation protein [Fimbriimonadia bacterium]|nr:phenylacetic acid degradation protein [Fimbriimonadia bacterium]
MFKQIKGFLILASLMSLCAVALADFDAYLKKPEPAYKWEKKSEKKVNGGTIYELHLVSQTWQGMNWEHAVQVFYPDDLKYAHFATLLNTGGNPNPREEALAMTVAKQSGGIFVVLYNIPKQPLFNNLYEDALIVYTWLKYLETGDTSWPLHFPMAKAVIQCMNAVQTFAESEKKPAVREFMITGASKRGWTTWLVGASRDPRVKGIAPMVIDTLNIPAQIPHQLASYGEASEQIRDYTMSGMLEKLNTPEGKKLLELEDPYSYRDRYTMPKLIINGTNDRYWTQDSLNLYWDGLKGPKWVLYVPNSGHGLEDRVRVLNTMSAFSRSLASKKPFPALNWEIHENEKGIAFTAKADPKAREARLFSTTSDTLDFRNSKWTSTPISGAENRFEAILLRPEKGNAVGYVEMVFDIDGQPFTLTTQLRIIKSGASK